MTGMMKKILSAFVAAIMLLSMTVFVAAETESKARFVVGEADENGVYTVQLSLHSIDFNAFQFGFNYNKDVTVPVDENGNPAEEFDDFVTAKTVEVEDGMKSFTTAIPELNLEDAYFGLVSYIMVETADRLVHFDEAGEVVYEFRFKKLADGACDFRIADSDIVGTGKNALISAGKDLDFTFEFVYPEGSQDQNSSELQESKPIVKPDDGFGENVPPAADDTQLAEQLREERKAGTIVLQIDNYAVSLNGVLKWVDKDNKNVVPYIENDRTMVPLRFISEAFGAEVTWDAETRTVGITLDETEITMQIDNQSYTINGDTAEMDVAPVIREDRTFVPLRFVSEALNKSVYWNGTTRVVVIAPVDKPWDDKDPTTQQLMTDTLWMFKWLRDEAYAHEN